MAIPIKKGKRQIAQRSDGYPHKLAKVDMQALDKALGVTVKMPDYHDVKTKYSILYRDHKKISEEFDQHKDLFLVQSDKLEKALEEVKQLNPYKKLLQNHYQQLYSSKTPEELQELIDEEIQIMMELDED
ncbi:MULTISPECIES: hypothetical protein [unclassified Pseudoalteromonas]|uniref:hypothetical protein n=1 Tax=unclassified Pseudoalteromonas TaxID=194690 RepID=UPI0005AB3210|nr:MULTISPECIES: hypothetical protein [unclassified Pseudoalteromonas]